MKHLGSKFFVGASLSPVRGLLLSVSMLLGLCAAAAAPAYGGPPWVRGPGGNHAPAMRWGGGPYHRFPGDFRRFGPGDRARWVGGGWRHDYYDGRWGWWWIVGGAWYWYDQPIYPYPTVVSAVAYPPPAPVEVAPPVMSAPPVVIAPGPQFRYYCPDRGYYPEVQTCAVDFVRRPIP